jgi:tetratricopeptide (TPR) repeat protein
MQAIHSELRSPNNSSSTDELRQIDCQQFEQVQDLFARAMEQQLPVSVSNASSTQFSTALIVANRCQQGMELINLGQAEKALESFRLSLKTIPGMSSLYLGLAYAYFELSNYHAAMAALEKNHAHLVSSPSLNIEKINLLCQLTDMLKPFCQSI